MFLTAAFLYFCGVKKRLLQIGSMLMALVVLFVSVGWDIKFHYCTEDHHLSGSFGMTAAETCLHCLSHEHEHEQGETYLALKDVIHYESKCCCDDFDSKIQFTDNFVFSSEQDLDIHFQPFVFVHYDLLESMPKAEQVFQLFISRKIPHFFSAKDRLVFFSALRLNPLVL